MGETPLSVPIITEVMKFATEVWRVIGGMIVPTVGSILAMMIFKSGPGGTFGLFVSCVAVSFLFFSLFSHPRFRGPVPLFFQNRREWRGVVGGTLFCVFLAARGTLFCGFPSFGVLPCRARNGQLMGVNVDFSVSCSDIGRPSFIRLVFF